MQLFFKITLLVLLLLIGLGSFLGWQLMHPKNSSNITVSRSEPKMAVQHGDKDHQSKSAKRELKPGDTITFFGGIKSRILSPEEGKLVKKFKSNTHIQRLYMLASLGAEQQDMIIDSIPKTIRGEYQAFIDKLRLQQ